MKVGCVLNHCVSSILTQCGHKILICFLPSSTEDQYDKMLLFLPKTWSNCVVALCMKQQEAIDPPDIFSFHPAYICIPWPKGGKCLLCCLKEILKKNPTFASLAKVVRRNPPTKCGLSRLFHLKFQNFLRNQNNKNNYNLVCETLQFLDCICGSTTGGLGLLGLYINEKNVGLINQTVESLTEYCQGPCHENQVFYLHIKLIMKLSHQGNHYHCLIRIIAFTYSFVFLQVLNCICSLFRCWSVVVVFVLFELCTFLGWYLNWDCQKKYIFLSFHVKWHMVK